MSKFYETVFPIYGRTEITTFLLLATIKFLFMIVLSLTRNIKDTLVVTQCGVESIVFLKVYGVLPVSIFVVAIYSKMSSVLSRQSLFYTTFIPFFLFFVLFNTNIYPNRHILEHEHNPFSLIISTISPILSREIGAGAEKGGSNMLSNIIFHWTSALYFVVAEVYASISIGILFWKFANDVVSVAQSKRFFPLFAYTIGLGLIVSGQYVVWYASQTSNFTTSLERLTAPITVSGIAICCLHHIMNKIVENRDGDAKIRRVKSDNGDNDQGKEKKKGIMTLSDSFNFLRSSRYLGLVSLMVLGHSIMHNFIEIYWQSLVKRQYNNPSDYQRFMGNFSSIVGVTSFIVVMLGSNVIKSLGWKVGALCTPIAMVLIAMPFFTYTVIIGVNSPTVLNVAVKIGAVMILMSRTLKHGFFDPTLQMAYVPLDDDSKVKGKAAIDVLGVQFGRSGASLMQQTLVVIFGDIITASPVVMAIFYAVSVVWIVGALKLSVLYNAKINMCNDLKKD